MSNTLSAQNPADITSSHQTRQLKEAVIEGSTGKVDGGAWIMGSYDLSAVHLDILKETVGWPAQ